MDLPAGRTAGLAALGLVVVDHLELLQPETRLASRELELEELSRGLKNLSRELGVPVTALSQNARDFDRRASRS